jgi:Lar family restriction alleviation protein
MSKGVELLPCPFCGSEKLLTRRDWGRVKVTCRDCGSSGPDVATDAGEIAANLAWNARPAAVPPAPPETFQPFNPSTFQP